MARVYFALCFMFCCLFCFASLLGVHIVHRLVICCLVVCMYWNIHTTQTQHASVWCCIHTTLRCFLRVFRSKTAGPAFSQCCYSQTSTSTHMPSSTSSHSMLQIQCESGLMESVVQEMDRHRPQHRPRLLQPLQRCPDARVLLDRLL